MLVIEQMKPTSEAAETIVRSYMDEVASRFYGRSATPVEVDDAVLDEPFDDLQSGTGVLLVAVENSVPVGCAGLRFAGDVAELTKVFVQPDYRRQGIAVRLVDHLNRVAAERGIRALRLDTRSDLIEACALYERLGFDRVAAFNDDPHSNRWYLKRL